MTTSLLKRSSNCACSNTAGRKPVRPRRSLAMVDAASSRQHCTVARRPAAHTVPVSPRPGRGATRSLPRSQSSRSPSARDSPSRVLSPPQMQPSTAAAASSNGGAVSRSPMASAAASILRGCFNCGRGGVMPGQMIADENGNRFCSAECGWSYLVQPVETQHVLRNTPRKLTSRKAKVDERKQFYQDLANVERVDQLLLKKMHRNPKYIRAMEALPKRTKQFTGNQQQQHHQHHHNHHHLQHEGREGRQAVRNARKSKMMAVQQRAREQVPEHVGALTLFQGLFGE